MNIVVVGIGQNLRGDDAAGIEAVRRWQAQYPDSISRPGLRVEISELPGLDLLNLLDGAQGAVIADAIQSSAPPGQLHLLGPDDLASFTPDATSAHGWGVAETLQLGRTLSPSLAKCRITLIGIEAGQMAMGAGLSPEVERALDQASDLIEKIVQALL
jgi:hydrogenase maturation protease